MKNYNKPTVTIGISAFNEEQNIEFLLRSLVSQTVKSAILNNIIIVSDASTDNTVSKIKTVKSKIVKLIENKKREGKANSFNTVTKCISADVLVFMDADVLIKDKNFIEKLIEPILLGKTDLASAKVEEIEPENLLEKILDLSMKIKKDIFETYNQGINLYTCHGRSLAFSKKLYTNLRYKSEIVAEDAYSYLYAKSHGFKYAFVKEARAFYKLPGNLADHQKQSIRFLQSRNQLTKEFSNEFVELEYRLPKWLVFKSFIKGFLTHPAMAFLYTSLLIGTNIKSLFSDFSGVKWEISKSSKLLLKSS